MGYDAAAVQFGENTVKPDLVLQVGQPLPTHETTEGVDVQLGLP